jgi:hypothetical protein
LATTRIAGRLPRGAGHYLKVVTQNLAGNKLDYYVRRSIHYAEGKPVASGAIEGTLTVKLNNTAPISGLPRYVRTRSDHPAGNHHPDGQDRLWVSVYLGKGAGLLAASVDGARRLMTSETEQGLSVFSTFVDVDPQGQVTLSLKVRQVGVASQPLTYSAQPLASVDALKLDVASVRMR